jgi:acetate kinase
MYKIMSVNAGSSSLKFKLYEMPEEKVLCSGIYEKIGHEDGIFQIKYNGEKIKKILPLKDHGVCVQNLIKELLDRQIIASLDDLKAVGHRIVQGGKYFSKTEEFDKKTEDLIESLIPLAPLHNAAHLTGFRAFKKAIPNVLETATFDTAFHQTMDKQDYIYPIPYEYTEKYDIRRYGAHGTSHKYVSEIGIKKYLNDKPNSKIISCHLGSGASITAIKDGKCIATSMGLTPLGGIMMGTRTGDIDPSVMNMVCTVSGKSCEEVYQMFNKQSGFQGVSGVSNDTRDVEEAANNGNERCKLAIQLFARRACDFIGQYFVRLGGCDLLIFTAGIGENSDSFRANILDQLKEPFGIDYDPALNTATHGTEQLISTPNSKIKVVVIPTDEEVMIARDAYAILMEKK